MVCSSPETKLQNHPFRAICGETQEDRKTVPLEAISVISVMQGLSEEDDPQPSPAHGPVQYYYHIDHSFHTVPSPYYPHRTPNPTLSINILSPILSQSIAAYVPRIFFQTMTPLRVPCYYGYQPSEGMGRHGIILRLKGSTGQVLSPVSQIQAAK